MTLVWDLAFTTGLALTTCGFAELGSRCGVGPSLALLWSGGWAIGLALWMASGGGPPPRVQV